jgi:osmoprotectant transport system permease protein
MGVIMAAAETMRSAPATARQRGSPSTRATRGSTTTTSPAGAGAGEHADRRAVGTGRRGRPWTRPSGDDRARSPARTVLRYAGLPTVLAAGVVALLVYLASADLDSIEARLLAPDRLLSATLRHLQLVAVSTVVVVLLAVPLGILATRPSARRIAPLIVGLGNVAQGVPSLGVLVLTAIFYGIGFGPAIFALVLYAFLPILRNTIVGLQQVDPFVVESARGMGLSRMAVLRRIELPLAVPVVAAGIRTAAVINVGTATIATLVNAGGLGDIIYQGLVLNRLPVTVVGAVLAAVLALFIDYLGGLLEDLLRPRGL